MSSLDSFSTRLCNLKSQLMSERRSWRRIKVEENKFEFQEQLETQKTTWNKIVEGENPDQILFPAEIWLQIFDYLSIRDVQNCFNTCRLFQGYLQPLGNLIKFGSVLPVLVQTGHLSVSNLFACRKVCKFWCDWVDELLENKRFWSQDVFSDTRTLLVHHSLHIKDEQLEYSNNPFIGRIVKLKSFSEQELRSSTYATVTPDEWFNNITLNTTCLRNARILETVGKHIHHLVVHGDMIILLKTRFLEKINNCSDLTSLRLTNTCDPDSYFQRFDDTQKFDKLVMTLPFPLLKLKTLRKLELKRMRNYSQRLKGFCTSLVERFSSQLQEFVVSDWHADYNNNNWKLLTKLSVKNCDSEEMLKGMDKLKAHNLRTLFIRFSYCNDLQTNWFEVLLKLLQNFPQLTDIKLEFECDKWRLSEEQLVELWDKFSHLCSTSITSIKLVNFNQNRITFSFLVFFPYLQKLTTDASKLSYNSPDSGTTTDLLELKDKVFGKDSSILYCVVWYILPFLRSITISSYRGDETRTFNRKLV